MNHLKDFIYDLNYIIEIYDDIVKTFKQREKIHIYNIYNKDDIIKFIKVNLCCRHTIYRMSNNHIEYIDIPDLIQYYIDLKIEIDDIDKYQTEELTKIDNHIENLIKPVKYSRIQDNKEYIYMVIKHLDFINKEIIYK
jgi:hypothetical protein